MKSVILKVLVLWAIWLCWLPGFKWAAAQDDRIRFTTNGATKSSYRKFIEELRWGLRDGLVHDISVLPDPTTLEERNRYVVVELSNSETESIQVGIDRTNAYVVAYRAGNQSYFFRDAPTDASNYLFINTVGHTLPFNGTYGDLHTWASRSRFVIPLGLNPLIHAISVLSGDEDNDQQRARALTAIIQMVPEAARFRHISENVARHMAPGQQYYMHDCVGDLQTSWEHLSRNVQQSENGIFPNPVILSNVHYRQISVSHITHPVVVGLALMKFVCWPNQQRPPPRLMRSTVEPTTVPLSGGDEMCVDFSNNNAYTDINPLILMTTSNDQETCGSYEPIVRISGRDGMCLDVTNSDYHDGNSIIMWTCKDQLEDNQLWTLKSDKTIRSKGKCLTTYGYDEGCYIMIYDCETAAREATQWDIWENGTIINPKSGLVLGVDKGGKLRVEINKYTIGQCWRLGNDTSAFVTMISGYLGLCMEAHDSNMWLGDCDTGKKNQQWAFYSDGSIRPVQNINNCLTSVEPEKEGTIALMPCDNGWTSQRWIYTKDGTIYNLYYGMVMEVKASDPSLQQIILWPSTGNDNQRWLTFP